MLTFFSTRKHLYTVETFLDTWASDLRSQIRTIGYEDLPPEGKLDPGTYIFCDQERWSPHQHRLAVALWEQLDAAGPAVCLLNDPRRVLLRFELLKRLHQCGQNSFDVHRVRDSFKHSRFPAFLHSLGGHEGPLSPRVKTTAALLYWIIYNGLHRPGTKLMVEEFCDVSVEGIYMKCGAFNIGGTILPRHLFFGTDWAQKGQETTQEDQLDQMETYLHGNPDAFELGKIFATAGIDFGRIDYAYHRGRIQVWEINTNPMIVGAIPDDTLPKEVALAEAFVGRFKSELLRLSSLSREGKRVSYRLASRF